VVALAMAATMSTASAKRGSSTGGYNKKLEKAWTHYKVIDHFVDYYSSLNLDGTFLLINQFNCITISPNWTSHSIRPKKMLRARPFSPRLTQ